MKAIPKYIYPSCPIPERLIGSAYRKFVNGQNSTVNVYLYDTKKQRFQFEKTIHRDFAKGTGFKPILIGKGKS